ncbi:MAG: T9SS type A sorting domain-containing protein, partial [Clostridia bacterium]|nr:T9SS type A sorting domain-containing protein [Clostridia bacterium]
MKTRLQAIIILLAMLLFASNAKSQGYFDDPTPFVTDNYDKQNAVLGYAADNLGWLVVYEQKTDSASTAIAYWRYLSNDPPVTLIAEPGVHYQNPKLYSSHYGNLNDSTGMVFYEKTTGETTGLYYIKLAPDGGQSAPYALATEGSINNLFALSYYERLMAYHSNGHLLAFYEKQTGGVPEFTTPDTVFSGEISDIKIQWNNLFWLAQHDDSTSLMMSEYNNHWTEPVVIKTEKEMSTIGGTTFRENSGWISYTYESAEKWHINNIWRYWGNEDEFQLEIENDSALDYDAFATWVAVKRYDPELYFCAFIHDTAGAREVFMRNIFLYEEEYFQLSNLGTECRNPKFFLGEYIGDNVSWGYLIWEAFVDGHWQFYRSRAPFGWSGIQEQQQPEGVSVSPNPARDFVRIQNSQELDLDIKIMDMSGRMILQMSGNDPEITIATRQWPRGVYILSATSG